MKHLLLLFSFFAVSFCAQAQIVTTLPAAGAVGDTDILIDVQGGTIGLASGGTTSAVTATQLKTYMQNASVLTTGSYSNPSWLTGLAWSKISSTPTTLAGYGITDALQSSVAATTYQPLNITLTTLGSANPYTSSNGVVITGTWPALNFAVGGSIVGNDFTLQQIGTALPSRVVNVGDSITAGVFGNGYSWPVYWQSMGGFTNCPFYNCGISGYTELQIDSLYASSQVYNSPPISTAGTYSPSSLYVTGALLTDQGGTNDISQIGGWYNQKMPTGSSNGTNILTVSSTIGISPGVYVQGQSVTTFTNDGTQPTDGSIVTIEISPHSTTYRFKITSAQAYDVQIGANAAATVQNLIYAINANGTAGTNYYVGTNPNLYASAGTISGTTFVLSAICPGAPGDSVATTTNDPNCSFTGTTMSGGTAVPYGTTVTAIGAGNITVSNNIATNASLNLRVSIETLAQFEAAAQDLWTKAHASGYKIARIDIIPRGLVQDGPLIQEIRASINTWLSQQHATNGAGWDYYWPISYALPNANDASYFQSYPGYPSYGEGLHPNQQGYQQYATAITAAALASLGSDFSFNYFSLNAIPDSFLSTNIAKIASSNSFGSNANVQTQKFWSNITLEPTYNGNVNLRLLGYNGTAGATGFGNIIFGNDAQAGGSEVDYYTISGGNGPANGVWTLNSNTSGQQGFFAFLPTGIMGLYPYYNGSEEFTVFGYNGAGGAVGTADLTLGQAGIQNPAIPPIGTRYFRFRLKSSTMVAAQDIANGHDLIDFTMNAVAGNELTEIANGNFQLDSATGSTLAGFNSNKQLISEAENVNYGGPVTMTFNATSAIIFNNANHNETIYNTSALTLPTATITLPSISTAGQIIRYVTNGPITTLMLTGMVDIGTEPTTLVANSSVAWQCDVNGHWIRLY